MYSVYRKYECNYISLLNIVLCQILHGVCQIMYEYDVDLLRILLKICPFIPSRAVLYYVSDKEKYVWIFVFIMPKCKHNVCVCQ